MTGLGGESFCTIRTPNLLASFSHKARPALSHTIDSFYFFIVKRTPIEAVRNPPPSSKVTFIVAILVSVVLFLLLLIIAAILYRRRQLYGGFYVCTTPPLPDLIARLDASIPLIEQVNKLPYDKRWEFPREQLEFGKD